MGRNDLPEDLAVKLWMRRQNQQEGRALALAVMWFLTLLIMATMAGMWYKIFWLGWVMAGGG